MLNSNYFFDKYQFDNILKEVNNTIESLSEKDLKKSYSDIFHCIDHTTLHDEDSEQSVIDFCKKAVTSCSNDSLGKMASVCVYPLFAEVAKKEVGKTGLKVAAVAGGFPSGQMPISLKIQEVRYAIDKGADEIDFVINRGYFLDGNNDYLAKEISSARRECGENVVLKVILETGELKNAENIYSASMIAMENGADFIKTSTGKSSVGATHEAAFTMLQAINDFQKNSNRKIGFKVSGGVSTIQDGLLYYYMTKITLGNNDINNQIFRIGTSKLASELIKKLSF